jgi:hypothetical protein
MNSNYTWRTRQEIEICSDCLQVSCSGAPTYEGYADSGHSSAYAAGLAVWGDEPYPMNDEDEGSFSWNSCDFCGEPLGGQRFTASLMQLHVEERLEV